MSVGDSYEESPLRLAEYLLGLGMIMPFAVFSEGLAVVIALLCFHYRMQIGTVRKEIESETENGPKYV